MYETHERWDVFGNHSVCMSFELSYHDWNKFRNTKEYQALVAYLEELDRSSNTNVQRDN